MDQYLLTLDYNRETDSERTHGKKAFEEALEELGSFRVLDPEDTYVLETKRQHIRVRRTLSRALDREDDLAFGKATKIQEI